jgi:hypothetical protein
MQTRNPLQSPGLRFIKVFGHIWNEETLWTIPIVLILATGIPVALPSNLSLFVNCPLVHV